MFFLTKSLRSLAFKGYKFPMATPPAQKLFAKLPGLWRLERTIPGQGRLEGYVTFQPQANGQLLYREEGELSLENTPAVLATTRSYLYAQQDDRLLIFYNDPHRAGDLMHELVLSDTGSAEHTHVCSEDRYTLTLSGEAYTALRMTYRISGPHKNYEMDSVLTRVNR